VIGSQLARHIVAQAAAMRRSELTPADSMAALQRQPPDILTMDHLAASRTINGTEWQLMLKVISADWYKNNDPIADEANRTLLYTYCCMLTVM